MVETYSIQPLLEMAGIEKITFRWPSFTDRVAIDAADREGKSDTRLWAALLNRVCDIPMPTAKRIALAHPQIIEVMMCHAFRSMRAALPAGDHRRTDRLAAALAKEAL